MASSLRERQAESENWNGNIFISWQEFWQLIRTKPRKYLKMPSSASGSDRSVGSFKEIWKPWKQWAEKRVETSEKCSGTFCSAHSLQQNIVFTNLFFVMLKFSPKLIQLLIRELPRGLGLKETWAHYAFQAKCFQVPSTAKMSSHFSPHLENY